MTARTVTQLGMPARPRAGRPACAPVVCNAAWDHAERETRAWAARVGFVTGAAGRRRVAKVAYGRMAGWLAPHAGPGELCLLAQWLAHFSLVDDAIDEEQGRRDTRRRRADGPQSRRCRPPAVECDDPSPAVRAMADLWRRTTPSSGAGWAQRFDITTGQFADATHEAARCARRARRSGARSTWPAPSYVGMLPVLDIVERGMPIEPDALDDLRVIVADTIGLVNDLVPPRASSAEGVPNLVTVVAREDGCELDAAAPSSASCSPSGWTTSIARRRH